MIASVLTPPLAFLGRNATTMMAVGVGLGLVLQDIAAVLRPYLGVTIWVLLYLAMLRIDWADLVQHIKRPPLILAICVWMMLVTPVLMWALVTQTPVIQFMTPGLIVACILTAATAPLMSTPAVGLILGLDGAILLLVLVAQTFIVPLTLPLAAAFLVEIDISTVDLMGRLLALVISTFVAAMVTRKLIGAKRIANWSTEADGLSVIMLIVFAVALMAGITDQFHADPGHVMFVTALTFAVYIGLQLAAFVVFGGLAGRALGRQKVLTASFVSGNRNLAILLAVLPASVHPDTFLYFVVAQFPIYLMPAILKAVVGRALRDEALRNQN